MRIQVRGTGMVLALVLLVSVPASAQPVGTFRWQLFPFCNVVTLSIQQILSAFVLVGSDDQCGGSQPAAAVGTAVLQPDGNARFGLTVVGPNGVPAHTEATVNPATLGGIWRDGEGNTGVFLPNPPTPTVGGPRPAPTAAGGALGAGVVTTTLLGSGAVTTDKLAPGAVGAAAVNPAEIPRLNAANAFNGLVTATGFSGNGSALTSLPAGQLVGVIPSAVLGENPPRVVHNCSSAGVTTITDTTDFNTTQTLVSATITTPATGHLVVVFNGSYNLSFGGANAGILAQLGLGFNSTESDASTRRTFVSQKGGTEPFQPFQTEGTTGLAVVPAGTHTVNALVRKTGSNGSPVVLSTGPQCLTVTYVERNGVGAKP